jgi:hypothetical protein
VGRRGFRASIGTTSPQLARANRVQEKADCCGRDDRSSVGGEVTDLTERIYFAKVARGGGVVKCSGGSDKAR